MLPKSCLGCKHRVVLNTVDDCCNYLLDVGHRRPCPVTNCTVREEADDDTKRNVYRVVKSLDGNLVRKMFEDGKSDREIAEVVGYSADYVAKYRRRNGLMRGYPHRKWDTELASKLVDDGLRDADIAEIVGTTRDAVSAWRRKNIKKYRERKNWNKTLALELFKQGKSDEEIAAAVERCSKTIANWRSKMKLYRSERWEYK